MSEKGRETTSKKLKVKSEIELQNRVQRVRRSQGAMRVVSCGIEKTSH
jgi:hypothetical protein